MKINTISEATRAMTVAFRLTNKMIGKSDRRRSEIKNTAKKLISESEDYMILRKVKNDPGITH